jgi:hypothetical protein
MSKRQAPKDGGQDDFLERCPRCNIHFATTTLDDASAELWWPLPVPISCLVCGGSTLCKLCVDQVDQCSVCGSASATCFDKNVPNVAFCRALDQIRDLKASGVSTSSKTVGDPDEDQQKPKADMNHNNSDIRDATTLQEEQLQVGDRVFCIWDSDGLYYPGRIGAVHSATQTGASSSSQAERLLSTAYKIDFEDGDTRWTAPRSDILTMAEAASKDLVVAGAVLGQENQHTEGKHPRAIESPHVLLGKGGQPYRQPSKKKKHA